MEAPPLTLVISPDLRSTPTMDQGRGFGNGFGLRPSPGIEASSPELDAACAVVEVFALVFALVLEFDCVVAVANEKLVVRGFISGTFPLIALEELPILDDDSFVALKPRIEPPIFGVASFFGMEEVWGLFDEEFNAQSLSCTYEGPAVENSLVGEDRFPAKPVDLRFVSKMSQEEKQSRGYDIIIMNSKLRTNVSFLYIGEKVKADLSTKNHNTNLLN